jgi:hypothetical protein
MTIIPNHPGSVLGSYRSATAGVRREDGLVVIWGNVLFRGRCSRESPCTTHARISAHQRKTAGAGSALNDRDCDGANWDRKPRRCYTAPGQKASGIRLRQGF